MASPPRRGPSVRTMAHDFCAGSVANGPAPLVQYREKRRVSDHAFGQCRPRCVRRHAGGHQHHRRPGAHRIRQPAYLSHQARTCGLHVHVNRTAFGETWEEQDEVIARILFFVENHWNELLRFSRRTRSQMEQWAARYGRKDDPRQSWITPSAMNLNATSASISQHPYH